MLLNAFANSTVDLPKSIKSAPTNGPGMRANIWKTSESPSTRHQWPRSTVLEGLDHRRRDEQDHRDMLNAANQCGGGQPRRGCVVEPLDDPFHRRNFAQQDRQPVEDNADRDGECADSEKCRQMATVDGKCFSELLPPGKEESNDHADDGQERGHEEQRSCGEPNDDLGTRGRECAKEIGGVRTDGVGGRDLETRGAPVLHCFDWIQPFRAERRSIRTVELPPCSLSPPTTEEGPGKGSAWIGLVWDDHGVQWGAHSGFCCVVASESSAAFTPAD